MTSSRTLIVLVLVLVSLLLSWSSNAAITCDDVKHDLKPCAFYLLTGSGNDPPPAKCCEGARSLKAAAETTADERTACECIKKLVQEFHTRDPKLAQDLPANCGITLPFTVSPNADCSKIG